MCVPKHHTTRDPDELGELNGTLQIIPKKNYKWFIKKGLQSIVIVGRICHLVAQNFLKLRKERSLKYKETPVYALSNDRWACSVQPTAGEERKETTGLKIKKCLRSCLSK